MSRVNFCVSTRQPDCENIYAILPNVREHSVTDDALYVLEETVALSQLDFY